MPPNRIVITSPATSANLGPGFDVFGLALAEPRDKIRITRTNSKQIEIRLNGISAQTISTQIRRNTAGVVAQYMINEFCLRTGLRIEIEKGIWPARGLGSSAAPAAAVAYGLNSMFDLRLSQNQLIGLASKGEMASAGSEHSDNVAAALCGGFVIVRSRNPVEVTCLKAPKNMTLAVAFPHIRTPAGKTEKARSLIPKEVPLTKLTYNLGKAAAMTAGFATGDVDLIGESMKDAVVEPARAQMVPNYERVKENALKTGAAGVTISGAGPAILAIVNSEHADASKVAAAMKESYKLTGYEATAFATCPGNGTKII